MGILISTFITQLNIDMYFHPVFYALLDSPVSKLGTKAFTIASHYVDLPFYYNL